MSFTLFIKKSLRTAKNHHEAFSLGLGCIGLFLSIIATGTAAISMYYTRETLNEMKSGSRDTHRLAEAAETQASATKELRDAAKNQADAGLDQVKWTAALANHSQQQLTELRISALAQLSSSRSTQVLALRGRDQIRVLQDSLKESASANQLAKSSLMALNRPYLKYELRHINDIVANSDFLVNLELLNSGNSIAYGVNARAELLILQKSDKYPDILKKCDRDCDYSIELPKRNDANIFSSLIKKINKIQNTEDFYKSILNLDRFIILLTRIDYRDMYGNEHLTLSCSQYLPQRDDLNAGYADCPGGNLMN